MFENYTVNGAKYAIVHPNSRYKISEEGQLFCDNKGIVMPYKADDGTWMIDDNLFDGVKPYPVALLSLIAYKKIRLPDMYLGFVETFHFDGNKDNLHPSNLGYRYIKPIEDFYHKGYYYIPFYNRYLIDKKGNVLNVSTGKLLKHYIYKPRGTITGGYRVYSVVPDCGIGGSTCGRYRLLALAFKDYPDNVNKLVVNHIDGDPTNDVHDNLEWVTYSENHLHAFKMGLKSQNLPCVGKNWLTGEVKHFHGVVEASRQTGVSPQVVTKSVDSLSEYLCSNGWVFKPDESTPWIPQDNVVEKVRAISTPTKVKSKNIFTGEVVIHDSLSKCGKDLNLEDPITPRRYLKKGITRPYFGYVFKYLDDTTPWPEYSDRQLEVFRDNPKNNARGVLAVHGETGDELFFTHVDRAQKHFKHILFKRNDVVKAINRKRTVNGYKLNYVA